MMVHVDSAVLARQSEDAACEFENCEGVSPGWQGSPSLELNSKWILLDIPDNQPHTGCEVAMIISFLYVSQFLVRCLRDTRNIGCPPKPH